MLQSTNPTCVWLDLGAYVRLIGRWEKPTNGRLYRCATGTPVVILRKDFALLFGLDCPSCLENELLCRRIGLACVGTPGRPQGIDQHCMSLRRVVLTPRGGQCARRVVIQLLRIAKLPRHCLPFRGILLAPRKGLVMVDQPLHGCDIPLVGGHLDGRPLLFRNHEGIARTSLFTGVRAARLAAATGRRNGDNYKGDNGHAWFHRGFGDFG